MENLYGCEWFIDSDEEPVLVETEEMMRKIYLEEHIKQHRRRELLEKHK